MNQYMNINRIEFSVTYSCTSRCRHCSLGDTLQRKGSIEKEAAVKAVNFTDDTVLTVAVCDAILYNPAEAKNLFQKKNRAAEYAFRYKQYYSRYPYAGFGQMFQNWANDNVFKKQKSYGNGGAMRVIPIAYAYNTLDEVLNQAKLSCIYTHNHREAINAAQATAAATFLAFHASGKEEIKCFLEKKFGYDFSESIKDIKKHFVFDSRAGYSVPPAIKAFLESDSYEDAVRKAVSLGGDSDTIACIAGGVAEAFYKTIPEYIKKKCYNLLDSSLKATIRTFCEKYINGFNI